MFRVASKYAENAAASWRSMQAIPARSSASIDAETSPAAGSYLIDVNAQTHEPKLGALDEPHLAAKSA